MLWTGAGCEEPAVSSPALHARAAVAALTTAGDSNTVSYYWVPAWLRHANHSGGRRATTKALQLLGPGAPDLTNSRSSLLQNNHLVLPDVQDYLFEAYLSFSRLFLTKTYFYCPLPRKDQIYSSSFSSSSFTQFDKFKRKEKNTEVYSSSFSAD